MQDVDYSSLSWRKASKSTNQGGNCVEVANLPDGGFAVRNSRFPDGAVLTFTAGERDAFLDGVKRGEFDRAE